MAGERVADLAFFSSAAKCFASDVAMEVTTNARRMIARWVARE
jgi:hypothetical protein